MKYIPLHVGIFADQWQQLSLHWDIETQDVCGWVQILFHTGNINKLFMLLLFYKYFQVLKSLSSNYYTNWLRRPGNSKMKIDTKRH